MCTSSFGQINLTNLRIYIIILSFLFPKKDKKPGRKARQKDKENDRQTERERDEKREGTQYFVPDWAERGQMVQLHSTEILNPPQNPSGKLHGVCGQRTI